MRVKYSTTPPPPNHSTNYRLRTKRLNIDLTYSMNRIMIIVPSAGITRIDWRPHDGMDLLGEITRGHSQNYSCDDTPRVTIGEAPNSDCKCSSACSKSRGEEWADQMEAVERFKGQCGEGGAEYFAHLPLPIINLCVAVTLSTTVTYTYRSLANVHTELINYKNKCSALIF